MSGVSGWVRGGRGAGGERGKRSIVLTTLVGPCSLPLQRPHARHGKGAEPCPRPNPPTPRTNPPGYPRTHLVGVVVQGVDGVANDQRIQRIRQVPHRRCEQAAGPVAGRLSQLHGAASAAVCPLPPCCPCMFQTPSSQPMAPACCTAPRRQLTCVILVRLAPLVRGTVLKGQPGQAGGRPRDLHIHRLGHL